MDAAKIDQSANVTLGEEKLWEEILPRPLLRAVNLFAIEAMGDYTHELNIFLTVVWPAGLW